MGHAEVDADRLAGLHSLDGRIGDLDHHRDVVPTGRMPGDGDGARIDFHAAADIQLQDSELGERQALGRTVEPKRAAGIFGAVPDPALLLEGGVGAALGEEICEGGLQMAEGLLKRDTRHRVEEGQIGVFLQAGQLGAGADKRQSFPTLEGGGSGRQHAVVDQAATAKGLRQVLGLRGGRIGPEGPTAFHGSIYHVKSSPLEGHASSQA